MPNKKTSGHWRTIVMPWLAFIIASFALAGCILILSQQMSDLVVSDQPIIAKGRIDKETKQEIENLKSQLTSLESVQSEMRNYLERATAGKRELDWSPFAMNYGVFTLNFQYPSLPLNVRKYSGDGSNGVEITCKANSPFRSLAVSINRGPVSADCGKVDIGGKEFCKYKSLEDWTYMLEVKDNFGQTSTVTFDFGKCMGMRDQVDPNCTDKFYEAGIEKVLKGISVELTPLLP